MTILRKFLRRWLVPGAAVLGLAALLAWFMFPRGTPPGAVDVAPPRLPEGRVVEVRVRPTPRTETAVGTVRAGYETTLSARLTATVLRAPVRDGDDVEAEQVLFELDDRDLRAQLAQAEEALSAARARLDDAERTAERISSLFERGVVSVAERDTAEAALEVARADVARAGEAVREARTRLTYATIRAPFAARLVERYVDPGDTVMPGVPMARLYDPDRLRLEADVREALARQMREVGAVTVRIDALDREVEGRVEEIVPAADPGSRTFVVKVGLAADPALFPGMFGRLTIPLGTVERYLVPEGAVRRVGQLEYVDAVVDGRLRRRLVRTGARTPDGWIEVRAGLEPGERVAVEPGAAAGSGAGTGAEPGVPAGTDARAGAFRRREPGTGPRGGGTAAAHGARLARALPLARHGALPRRRGPGPVGGTLGSRGEPRRQASHSRPSRGLRAPGGARPRGAPGRDGRGADALPRARSPGAPRRAGPAHERGSGPVHHHGPGQPRRRAPGRRRRHRGRGRGAGRPGRERLRAPAPTGAPRDRGPGHGLLPARQCGPRRPPRPRGRRPPAHRFRGLGRAPRQRHPGCLQRRSPGPDDQRAPGPLLSGGHGAPRGDRHRSRGRDGRERAPAPGLRNGAWAAAFERVVVPALERFRPELILVPSGFDGGAYDPMGRMMMTSEGYRHLARTALRAADRLCGGRIVCIHEGGYHAPTVPFHALAVIETLSGRRTPVEDPFLPIHEGLGQQALQPHQAALLDRVVALHGL